MSISSVSIKLHVLFSLSIKLHVFSLESLSHHNRKKSIKALFPPLNKFMFHIACRIFRIKRLISKLTVNLFYKKYSLKRIYLWNWRVMLKITQFGKQMRSTNPNVDHFKISIKSPESMQQPRLHYPPKDMEFINLIHIFIRNFLFFFLQVPHFLYGNWIEAIRWIN